MRLEEVALNPSALQRYALKKIYLKNENYETLARNEMSVRSGQKRWQALTFFPSTALYRTDSVIPIWRN